MSLLEQEILEGRVIQTIEEELGYNFEVQKWDKESKLVEDMGVDSLDIVFILEALEQEFTIEISNDEVSSWKTLQDIINYITKRMEETKDGE